MKKILTLVLFSALAFPVLAQAQTAQSAPEYTLRGVKVYERGVRLLVPDVKNVFLGTPAYHAYVKGVKYNRIGNALLWPGVGYSAGGIGLLIVAASSDNGTATVVIGTMGVCLLIPGIPLIATGIVFKVKGKRKVARAVGMYNEHIASSAGNYLPEISLGATPGGLGIAYRF